jgi:uncharacterized delta-60 repeat protein
MSERENTGAPDPSFGAGGVFRLPDVGEEQYLTALAPRSNGGLLGVATARSFDSFHVYGLTREGILDSGFREGGKFQDRFDEPAIVRMIHTRDDGKFLVAGELTYGVALARYEASGEFDPTFNGGRKVIIPHSDLKLLMEERFGKAPIHRKTLSPGPSGIPDTVGNVRCVADDDRVYYGFDASYGKYERLIVVVCLTHDGELDSSFGSNGHFILAVEGSRGPWSGFDQLAIQSTPEGTKLLGLGYIPDPEFGKAVKTFLFRLDRHGSIDTSFGAAPGNDAPGIAWLTEKVEAALTLTILASGTICVGGTGERLERAIIAGCTGEGAIDVGFNNGEPVYSSPPRLWSSIAWGQPGTAERLILGSILSGSGNASIGLRRFDSQGTPDKAFGEDGLQMLQFTRHKESIVDPHIMPLSSGQSYIAAGEEIYRLQA